MPKWPLAQVLLTVAGILAATAAQADFAEGVAAYEAGDFGRAAEAWRPLADEGDPDAQLAMGILYENGRGVSRDYEAAIAWYTKAAEAGNPGAQFNLGNMYHEGVGVPVDSTRAVIWWTLAAEQGLPGAMLNLGIAYHLGDGVTHDPVKAFQLFSGAAEAGIPAAQFSAAYAYELGLGTEQNLPEARRLYTLAAEAGLEQASERLVAMDLIDVEPLVPSVPEEEETVAVSEDAATTAPEATPPQAEPQPAGDAMELAEPAAGAEIDVAEADSPETVEEPAVADDGFAYIQLAAFLTESRAEVAWRELSTRHADLLGDLPYRIRRVATSGESGAVYGLQVGPMPAPDEARAICNSLKAQNADCFLTGP